jgi:hypothetical protein
MKLLLTEADAEYFANTVYVFLGLLSEKFSKEQITALLAPEKIERYLTALDDAENST